VDSSFQNTNVTLDKERRDAIGGLVNQWIVDSYPVNQWIVDSYPIMSHGMHLKPRSLSEAEIWSLSEVEMQTCTKC